MKANDKIMEDQKSPIDVFGDTPKLSEVLSDDTPWLAKHFPKELAVVMKGKLEAYVMKTDVFKMLIYGLQGLRITNSRFVYTRKFQNSSRIFRAFVYRMLMSSRQRKNIAKKMKEQYSTVADFNESFEVLQMALDSDRPENVEKLEKIIDSASLLPDTYVSSIVNSTFSIEERISLLRRISDIPDVYRTNRTLWTLMDDLTSQVLYKLCNLPDYMK